VWLGRLRRCLKDRAWRGPRQEPRGGLKNPG
jgi:hypothetical protein